MCNRLRLQMLHLRDAKRDMKVPPQGSQQVLAIMNMISTDAVNASADESENQASDVEVEEEARPAAKRPTASSNATPPGSI